MITKDCFDLMGAFSIDRFMEVEYPELDADKTIRRIVSFEVFALSEKFGAIIREKCISDDNLSAKIDLIFAPAERFVDYRDYFSNMAVKSPEQYNEICKTAYDVVGSQTIGSEIDKVLCQYNRSISDVIN